MRTLAALLLTASVAASASALDRSDDRAAVTEIKGAIARGRVMRDARGAVRDAWAIPLRSILRAAPDTRTAADMLAASVLSTSEDSGAITLDEPSVVRSLAGTHYHYRERFRGVEVVDGDVVVTVASDGATAALHNRLRSHVLNRVAISAERARAATGLSSALLPVRLVARGEETGIRFVYKVVGEVDRMPWAFFVDAGDGRLVAREPQFFNARGSVFDANPVTVLNDPSLRDMDDSPSAVPSRAYSGVEIPDLDPASTTLTGPYVAIADLELPATTHASPDEDLHFDRGDDRFEEVNAYFQLDRSQRYLQSIGFSGPFAIAARSIPVDAHAAGGGDRSYYKWVVAGQGQLYYGDGGTDDAEDADIVLHEYGHAMLDSIDPGGFAGPYASQSRALGEAFGDYWAFSSGYEASVASGRDPFCIADWDARCGDGGSTRCEYPPGADCLRRVDSTKTMADYADLEVSGTEHANGAIWSSALRDIFMRLVARDGAAAGKRLADRTIVEGMFGLPPLPTFHTAALQLLDADRRLNNGADSSVICTAMSLRGILSAGDCDLTPDGDWTIFQSPDRNVAIPDTNPSGVSSVIHVDDPRTVAAVGVHVRIRHTRRGEVVLRLTSPAGTTVVLQNVSADNDTIIDTTYGIDAEAASSLAVFAGTPVAGDWTLNASDSQGGDTGELISWDLQFRFLESPPVRTRTGGPSARKLFVAGATSGASQTEFATGLRMRNAGTSPANVTLYFTPSGGSSYSAVNVTVAPAQTVDFENIVRNLFHTAGIGWLEIEGDTAYLVISSLIENVAWDGLGQQVREIAARDVTTSGDAPLHLSAIERSEDARSNIGLVETSGTAATAVVHLFDLVGTTVGSRTIDLPPFGHTQFSVSDSTAVAADVVVVSGGGSVAAYVSRIDNASGDAAFFPPAHTFAAGSSGDIPGVIDSPSGVGRWSSTLFLRDVGGSGSVVRLTLHTASGEPKQAALVIAPSATVRLSDLPDFFATGALVGHVELNVDSGTVAVTSMIVNAASGRRIGESVEAFDITDAIRSGSTRQVVFVDHGSGYRANFGFSEVTGKQVMIRLRIVGARGDLLATIERTVPAFGFVEIFGDAENLPEVSNGAATVEVISGHGGILGWASIVDNRSSDFRLVEF